MAPSPRDLATIGPREGTPFPGVALPDQGGAAVELHAARRGRRAPVVLDGSAEW
jgi:hypothetical protein